MLLRSLGEGSFDSNIMRLSFFKGWSFDVWFLAKKVPVAIEFSTRLESTT